MAHQNVLQFRAATAFTLRVWEQPDVSPCTRIGRPMSDAEFDCNLCIEIRWIKFESELCESDKFSVQFKSEKCMEDDRSCDLRVQVRFVEVDI